MTLRENLSLDSLNIFRHNQTTMYSYSSMDQLLVDLGSTEFWDAFWLFAVTPISLFALFGNLLSFYIFNDPSFSNMKLFSFLRYYAFTNTVRSLFNLFDFVFYSRRYTDWVNSYASTFYQCYIHEPITSTAYFFDSIIGIIILLDRLSTFSRAFQLIPAKMPVFKLMLGSFIGCAIINGPYFLVKSPSVTFAFINNTQTVYEVFYVSESYWSKTIGGRILTFAVYFIRDLSTMIVGLVLSTILLYNFKKFAKGHRKIAGMEKRNISDQENSSNLPAKAIESCKLKAMFSRTDQPISLKAEKKSVNMEKRVTGMISVMRVIEIIEHSSILVSLIYCNFTTRDIPSLEMLGDVVLILKNALDFPIFYIFNVKFRKAFKLLFQRKN